MKKIFSGIQPTNHLHIGNYLGAIKQWLNYQKDSDCLFCVVDLHAITINNDPTKLRENSLYTIAAYIACGIEPKNIIIQSEIPHHAELMWILSCFTPLGWLNRMTQFKEKSEKNGSNLGLLAYPVLQAADVLLYDTTHVPVGEDQKQHIELARDIAGAFNRYAKKDILALPHPVISKENFARVMSLKDPQVKMSKSDPSELSRINLDDDPDTIRSKISKAKTDPLPLPSSLEELEGRAEALNLYSIYSGFTGKGLEEVVKQFEGAMFSQFKKDLAEVLIETIEPIRNKTLELINNKDYLEKVTKEGRVSALAKAEVTLNKVKKALGLK